MKRQYLLALMFTVTLTGFSLDLKGECLHPPEIMPCNVSIHLVYVNIGDILLLNCPCFHKTNGQWIGPKKNMVDSKAFIPYTQGLELNEKLNKSKYQVVGGYDITKCNLQITNFLSEDDGIYRCRYIESSKFYVDVYNVVATIMPSENHVTKSMQTEIYTFETKHMKTPYTKVLLKQWILPVIVVLITCVVVIVVLLWRKKDKRERYSRRIHNIETDAQDEPVENRLYQSSQFLETNNVLGQNRVFRNETLSSSQMHADQRYRARVTRKDTGHCSGDIVSYNANAQINEINMNYAEVEFDAQPLTHRFIIHGNDDRTVYSEIDHSIRAEPLPSSSSESEDD